MKEKKRDVRETPRNKDTMSEKKNTLDGIN